MLDTLITSKTRLKLLLKFFLNSNATSYLRQLESEFGESSNAIRLELNRFEQSGLLTTKTTGYKKFYRANTKHPLFQDINTILHKYIGFDKIVENVINKLGDVEYVHVVGDFARGMDNQIIDLIFVGKNIDREYLARLVEKSEKLIKRKIRYVTFGRQEFKNYIASQKEEEILLLWKK